MDDEVMSTVEDVGKVDKFVGTLWRRCKEIRDEGIMQVLIHTLTAHLRLRY